MNAWLFQDHRQKQKLGDKCPWSVGWVDPEGNRKSKKVGSESMATKFQRKIEGQLAAGTYESHGRKHWGDFRVEYESKILPGLAVKTKEAITTTLNHFEKHVKPYRVSKIGTAMIDDFIAKRQTDRGRKPDTRVSTATVNHDLRHLKATLRVAVEWGYLSKMPKVRRVREEERIGHIMSQGDFQKIYESCDSATMPRGLTCGASDWWRALLVFAITTGWRIDEILSFRRDDLDLETGSILTRATDNKGKRDSLDYLPPVALTWIKQIVGFGPMVFPWPHNSRTLWVEFGRIQEAASIKLPCRESREHVCTSACHLYGFHALRRSYATLNADSMPAAVLQKKMRHKSFTTTLKYIGLSDKMKKSADVVYVPEFLSKERSIGSSA